MAYNQKNNPFLKKSPARQEKLFSITGNPKQKKQGIIPEIFGGKNPRAQYKVKKKLKEWEEKISTWLGHPMKEAREYAQKHASQYEFGPQLEEHEMISIIESKESKVDQIRHALAGAYTADKVGIVGANILGMAHELISPNTPEEHKSDLINNAIGSVVGGIVPDEKIEQTIEWLSERGWLHEYKKQ